MSASDNGSYSAIGTGSVDWLESAQPLTVSTDRDGVITVECSGDYVDVVLAAAPPVSELRMVVQHHLKLRAAPSAEPMHGCLLSLDAQPGSPAHRSGLSLEVDSPDTPLRFSSAARLSVIDSSGDHEFDLIEPHGVSSIVVESGITTLRKSIENAEILGLGKLRALGEVTRCHINMQGSFEAHSAIVTSDVLLGGDLEAVGVVSLSNEKLECRNATLRGGLDSDGIVSCETLEVHGRIESTGAIMVRDLRCTGTLNAERLAVLGSIEVPGG